MHFQIYIPGVVGADPQHLVAVGLESLTLRAQFLEVLTGPDKRSGMLAGWMGGRTRQIAYRPDQQTWTPAVAFDGMPAGRYWIGFWNDSPPTPEDLQRDYAYPGAKVRLGDERQWLLPRAYELPAEMIRADDGTWKYETQRKFHAFRLESLDWHRRLMDAEEGESIRWAPVAEFVERALAINYRITPEVVNQLRLFTTSEAGTVSTAFAALMEITRQTGGDA